MLIAHAGRALAGGEIDTGLVRQHGNLAVEHAEVNLLAVAGLGTGDKG